MWDITKSPFYRNPDRFLKDGERVRAKVVVYEDPAAAATIQPGDPPAKFPAKAYIHAQPGEFGTVVGNEKGYWPTVRFDRSGSATCVTDFEVEPLPFADDSAYADHGNIVVAGNELTRAQAIEHVRKVAAAILQAGDLSNPDAISLVVAAEHAS